MDSVSLCKAYAAISPVRSLLQAIASTLHCATRLFLCMGNLGLLLSSSANPILVTSPVCSEPFRSRPRNRILWCGGPIFTHPGFPVSLTKKNRMREMTTLTEVTETVDCSSSSMAYIPWKSHEGERKAVAIQKPLFCQLPTSSSSSSSSQKSCSRTVFVATHSFLFPCITPATERKRED